MSLKNTLVAGLISLIALPVSASDDLRLAQNILNTLGYDVGIADGLWESKTKNAFNNFYQNQDKIFDGNFDSKKLADLIIALPRVRKYSNNKKYKIYSGLPCKFNGVIVEGINNAATLGPKNQKCCPGCKGYATKEGQTLHAKRGRPVYAIADMTLLRAYNRSAVQRSGRHLNKNIRSAVSKPYDDLHLTFQDRYGNKIVYYHLQSENPFVPGFGHGQCSLPLEFQTEKWKRNASNCGGVLKWDVKKGDIIGFVGSTGGPFNSESALAAGEHISFGIYVSPMDPRFNKQTGLVVPSHHFTWETTPSNDPMKYLLPL